MSSSTNKHFQLVEENIGNLALCDQLYQNCKTSAIKLMQLNTEIRNIEIQ